MATKNAASERRRDMRRTMAAVLGLATIGLILSSALFRRERPGATGHPSITDPAPSSERVLVATETVAATVAGSVRSSGGDRIAGAKVCAVDAQSSAIGRVRTTCVRTDSDGSYSIGLSATGAYAIDAESPGFQPGSAQKGQLVVVAWGERRAGLDIVLEHGGVRVAGVVLDVTGGPVVGAVVRATRFVAPPSTVEAESDRDGKFELWTLEGHLGVSAQAVGYVPTKVVDRVAPTGDVVFRLTPGSNVHGRVVSVFGHKPVADIEVRAVPAQGGTSPLTRPGKSDSDGAFVISGLPPGQYSFAAQGEGWRGGSDHPVNIGLVQTVTEVTVTVTTAATVAGRVLLRADDSPCERGSVSLGPPDLPSIDDPPSQTDVSPFTPGPRVPSMLSTIETSGVVRFNAVPQGTYRATVRCADHILAEGPTVVDVGPSNVDSLVWKVQQGLGFVVHMVDEEESPLPGAVLSLRSRSRPFSTVLVADSHGQYEYPSVLYPGVYMLVPGHKGYTGDPVDLDLREGMGKVETTVHLKGQGSIFATIRGVSGDPIDDVTVRAVRVDAAPSGSSPASPSTGGGQGAPSEADRSDLSGPYEQKLMYVGASLGSGRFRIGPLPRGKYEVQASDGVNAPFEPGGIGAELVEVVRGAVPTTITVDRRSGIRGAVVDGSGQPMPDVWVRARCEANRAGSAAQTTPFRGRRSTDGMQTMSGKDGRFEIKGLSPNGLCTVRAEEPFGLSGVKNDVRPGDDVVVPLSTDDEASGTASLDNGLGRSPGGPATP